MARGQPPSSFLTLLTSFAATVGTSVEPARALARLVLEHVPRAGLLAHDLAGPGHPEALLGAAVRLVLRHGCPLVVLSVGVGRLVRRGCCGRGRVTGVRARAACWLVRSLAASRGCVARLVRRALALGHGLAPSCWCGAEDHDHVAAVLLGGDSTKPSSGTSSARRCSRR